MMMPSALDLMFMVLIIGVFISMISPLLLFHPHIAMLLGVTCALVGLALCILFRRDAVRNDNELVVKQPRREQIGVWAFRLGCVLMAGSGVTFLFALKVLVQR